MTLTPFTFALYPRLASNSGSGLSLPNVRITAMNEAWLCCTHRVSLCCSSCPGAHYVDKDDLKFRDLPVSASQVLGLRTCATINLTGYFSFESNNTGQIANIHDKGQ